MAFLRLNGIDVPIAISGGFKQTPEILGSRKRAFSGDLRETRRARKRSWSCQTTPITEATALPLIALIEGQGYSWRFDADTDEYGGKGLGPASGSNYTLSTADGKFDGHVSIASTAGHFIRFAAGFIGDYTVFHWKDEDDAGDFDWTYHYTYLSDGTKYRNGVAGAFNIDNWTTFASGNFDFEGKDTAGANAIARYDEIYIIPEKFTATQVSEWYTLNNTRQFPQLPAISLDGDCVPDTSVNVIGEVTDIELIMLYLDGVFTDNAHVVSFTLEEV